MRRRRETPNFLHTLSNTNVIKKNISVPASTPILHFDPRTKFFRKGASGFLIAGIVLLEQRCKYLHVYIAVEEVLRMYSCEKVVVKFSLRILLVSTMHGC